MIPNSTKSKSFDIQNDFIESTLKQFAKLNFNKDIGEYLSSIATELQLMEEMQLGVYLLDYKTGKYLYFSDYLKELMGIKKKENTDLDISYCVKLIHPEDSVCLFQILNKVSKTIKSLDEQEKRTISFKINYRIKTKNNHYSWVMQMNKVIYSATLDFPIYLGYIVSVPDNNSFKQIAGYLKSSSNSWVLKYKPQNKKRVLKNLTEREEEVLKLANKGNNSKEIALMLDISIETIKIHKKNIIKKLGVNSTLNAIRMYEKLIE